MEMKKVPSPTMEENKLEGADLDDRQIADVAGGTFGGPTCPRCGSHNIEYAGCNVTVCNDCGYSA